MSSSNVKKTILETVQ